MQLLIVDDHALLLDALEIHLGMLGQPLRVWKATSMPQALAIGETVEDLDLAILDLYMPDMDGISGMQRLREKHPDLPVVIISGDESPETVRAAMNAGASGFIAKSMKREAMQDALRRVLAGERVVPDGGNAPPVLRGPEMDLNLTPREQDVLAKLVEGQSNKEIARGLQVEASTVALHLTHLYRKLGVTGRGQAISRALNLGIAPAP